MTIRAPLTPREREQFPIGAAVRYRPGSGTYGLEDCIEADGRLPGVVRGHTDTRVRLELTLTKRRGQTVRRAVNAASLILAAGDPTSGHRCGRAVGCRTRHVHARQNFFFVVVFCEGLTV